MPYLEITSDNSNYTFVDYQPLLYYLKDNEFYLFVRRNSLYNQRIIDLLIVSLFILLLIVVSFIIICC